MNKYVEEGKAMFNPKSVRYVNPYPKGTKEYNYFERGWTQALKMRLKN